MIMEVDRATISLNHLIRMVNKTRVSTHFLIVNSPSSEYKRQIRVTSMMYALFVAMKSKKNRKYESCRYASTSFIKTVLTNGCKRSPFVQIVIGMCVKQRILTMAWKTIFYDKKNQLKF